MPSWSKTDATLRESTTMFIVRDRSGQPFRTADIEYLERVAHHLDAGLDLPTARRRAATELAEERYVRDGDVWLKK